MRSLFLSVLALMFAGLQALAEERYALVFGNESYDPRVGVLSNPHEDAEKVAAALRQVGFEVIGGVRKDADRAAIWAGIYELQSKLTEAGADATGFVFYAGHGGSHEARGERSNYLIPVGPAITGANQLPALGVDLGDVIGTLEKAKAQSVFIVLDACRNTLPWTTNMGGAQPDRGWSEPEEVAGMLLSYSTADGATAPDDGVFADVLARHLVKPNLSADRMFTLVGREVATKRNSTRRPAVSDQLRKDFFFAGRIDEEPSIGADELYWLQVTANRSGQQICEGYQSYLSSYPNGAHSNRARQLLSVPPCRAVDAPTESRPNEKATSFSIAKVPIALPDFKIINGDPKVAADITSKLRTILRSTENLDVIFPPNAPKYDAKVDTAPVFSDWNHLGAKFVLMGAYEDLSDGRIKVSFRLWDSENEKIVRFDDNAGASLTTTKRNIPALVFMIRDFVLPNLPGAARRRFVPGSVFHDRLIDGSQGPEMVVVPAGSFLMGSPDSEVGREDKEGPQRRVTISQPFAVGKFEVTWAEWEACVSDGGCESNLNKHTTFGSKRGRWLGQRKPPSDKCKLGGCSVYTSWLSQRTGEEYGLLSEAQWEYAARAGSTGRFSWGDSDPICTKDRINGANFGACNTSPTEPVGSFKPNAFGLYDMHGNVWEWVEDCYENSYSGAPSDGSAYTKGRCDSRVTRGGSWHNMPGELRSAARGGGLRHYSVGFRLTRALP